MQSGLMLPCALREGVVVHISEVESGRTRDCLCPGCSGPLVARKGPKLAHHFAHDHAANCNTETALHAMGKRLIHDGILRALNEKAALPLRWKCAECRDEHHGELLRKLSSVQLEQSFGPTRPDLLLIDKNGKPFAAIEVIVTHPPEDSVKAFYRRERIALIEVRLKTGVDLNPLFELSELKAAFASVCKREKCPQCNKPLLKRWLNIAFAECYRCHARMKISFVNVEGNSVHPPQFNSGDIKLAQQNGCILAIRFSQTAGNSYRANICPACKAMFGNHYLLNYESEFVEKLLPSGFHCSRCSQDFPEPQAPSW